MNEGNITLLKQHLEVIKSGSREEVRAEKKLLEKFWHDRKFALKEKEAIFRLYSDEIKNFERIGDIDHQADFVSTLKWVFFYLGREFFEPWADLVLIFIQHPSGKIRQAIVKASDWLIMAIAVDLSLSKETKKGSKERKRSIYRFGSFVGSVEDLLAKYDEPRFRRYKYISSVPAGVYKSLQILIMEVLLRSEHYERIYDEYLSEARQPADWSHLQDIKLKNIQPKRKPRYKDKKCHKCGKGNIIIGSFTKTDPPKFFCEDCTISAYQKEYNITTKKGAAARRRRIFDVPYLFSEMLIDKYLVKMKLKSVDDLTFEELSELTDMSKDFYNAVFLKEEKKNLEVLKQKEIEKIFRMVLKKIDL